MGWNTRTTALIFLIAFGTWSSPAVALDKSDTTRSIPGISASGVTHLAYCTATHDVGKLSLLMTNGGMIGIDHFGPDWQMVPPAQNLSPTPYTADSSGCHLGRVLYGAEYYGGEYPTGSGDKCLGYAALWVGGIAENGDTLVSVGLDDRRPDGVNFEFYPDVAPFGNFYKSSLLDPGSAAQARSDQDYRAVYTDTFKQGLPGLLVDWRSHRQHRPLGLKITQTSSEWSNALVDKFILVEYRIANIGRQDLTGVYAGLLFSPIVAHIQTLSFLPGQRYWGTTGGFLRTFPSLDGCQFIDTLDIAWGLVLMGVPKMADGSLRASTNPIEALSGFVYCRLRKEPKIAVTTGGFPIGLMIRRWITVLGIVHRLVKGLGILEQEVAPARPLEILTNTIS